MTQQDLREKVQAQRSALSRLVTEAIQAGQTDAALAIEDAHDALEAALRAIGMESPL